MGDDGVGIHTVNKLKKLNLSDHVDVMDGGTAGIGLVDILSSYRTVIVIDAIMDHGDGLSGISLFSPDDLLVRKKDSDYSLHDMELTSVLRLMKALDIEIPDIKIIGIPATTIIPGVGLSEECGRFVHEAVDLVMAMINPPIPPFIKGGNGGLKRRDSHDCLR